MDDFDGDDEYLMSRIKQLLDYAKGRGLPVGSPVAWAAPQSLDRVSKNDGVLAKMAFDERLSNQRNDVQTVPLYKLF